VASEPRPSVVLCCPDSLKGVLSAQQAASSLAVGVRAAGAVPVELPLADGGEGTAEALAGALGGTWRTARVRDPLGRPVDARWLELPGGRAVVESAEAIGLWRLEPSEHDPLCASSFGLGELLLSALASGVREVIVTLGGSATVDGGSGLRTALAGADLGGVRLRAACDVRNPLLGERGAARVFGPQKGATPAQVIELERRLAAMTELAPFADTPGAGAAGGLGAALAALGASLEPGADLVLDAVRFRERLASANLAITGEGTVDRTSAEGKVPGAVAAACHAAGVLCVVFGGRVTDGSAQLRAAGADEIVSLSGNPARAREDLEALAERVARRLESSKPLVADDAPAPG
jgi:glycerate kinase